MDILVSIISLVVIVTVTAVLLYQNASVKDNTTANIQSVVNKINDASYYSYQYDKQQEQDIQVLDKNINTVSKDVASVNKDLQDYKKTIYTKDDINKTVNTKNLSANNFALGKYNLNGTEDDDLLKLKDKDGKIYGGFQTRKLQVDDLASFNMIKAANDVDIGNHLSAKRFTVNSAKSVHNPENWNTEFPSLDGTRNVIGGDSDIIGNVKISGNTTANKALDVGENITIRRQKDGAFIENVNSKNTKMNIGFTGDDMSLFNEGNSMSMALGKDKTQMLKLENSLTNKKISIGDSNGLSIFQVNQPGIGSKLSTKDDFVIRGENANARIMLQNGYEPGVMISGNHVGIGGAPLKDALEVYGDMSVRGNQIKLGLDDKSPDTTNVSDGRVLVRKGNEMVLNYQKDFAGGVSVQSDLIIDNNNCLQVGRNAGKICYKDNQVKIDGALTQTQEREVYLNDILKTNKICLGSTCISESQLKTLLAK